MKSRGRESPVAQPRTVGGARAGRGGSGRKWFRVRGPAGGAAAVEGGCRVRGEAGGGGGGGRDLTEGRTGEWLCGAEGAWRLRPARRACPSRGRGGSWNGRGGGGEEAAAAAAGRMRRRRRLELPGNRSPDTTLGRCAGAPLRLSDPGTCCHGPPRVAAAGLLGVSAAGMRGAVSGTVPFSPVRPELVA